MSKNISDLLDSLEYNPLEVKPVDIVLTDKIKELTLNKIANSTTAPYIKWRKRLSVLLIAATLGAIALGVAYTTDFFNLGKYFRELNMRSETEMKSEDLEILESIGVSEDIDINENISIYDMLSVTSNGTTMTVTAAVYDRIMYYIVIEIIAPDGTVLERGDSYWQLFGDNPEERLKILDKDGNSVIGTGGMGIMFNDEIPGDNKLTIILEIQSDGVRYNDDGTVLRTTFGDGISKILHIQGLWLQSPDKDYTKILDGIWSFDLEAIGISGAIPGTEAVPNQADNPDAFIDPLCGEPLPADYYITDEP